MTKSFIRPCLILVCVVNALLLARTGYRHVLTSHRSLAILGWKGSDYPGQLYPTLPQRLTQFPDEDYLSLLGEGMSTAELNALDVKWKAFMPVPDTGFFHFGEHKRPLDLPMYHQLHCIWGMRRGLFDLGWHHMNDWHMHHCLNYMRQLILCQADTTLEPFDLTGIESGAVKHGSPVPFERTCRDWKFIESEVVKNQAAMRQFAFENNLPPSGIDPTV